MIKDIEYERRHHSSAICRYCNWQEEFVLGPAALPSHWSSEERPDENLPRPRALQETKDGTNTVYYQRHPCPGASILGVGHLALTRWHFDAQEQVGRSTNNRDI